MTAAPSGLAALVSPRPIRLMIVDDSGFMRVALRKMLQDDPEIAVVGEARDGAAAVELARTLHPDVITMDVEMPVMDGLAAVRAILAERHVPIIMISSLTTDGASATLAALRAGAVDYISKSSSFVQLDIVLIEQELRRKVRHWGKGGSTVRPAPRPAAPPLHPGGGGLRRPVDLLVIGVSTGGPRTVPELLQRMGRLSCPVVIAQHMPEIFTESYARQLRSDTGLDVSESRYGAPLAPGSVCVLKGGTDGAVRRLVSGGFMVIDHTRASAPIHPSADILFESAAREAANPVALILTGMGNDGCAGAREFIRRGFAVLVQEPSSCVVGGMPSAALEAGAATAALSLEDLGRRLTQWAGVSPFGLR